MKQDYMKLVVMSKDNTGWFVVQSFGNMETAKQFLTMLRNKYPSYQYKISE